jgi:predicted ATPase
MITKLHLENFKAHRDTRLELSPFTVLVGDNGSGKTSVLEALQLSRRLQELDLRSDSNFDIAGFIQRKADFMQLSIDGPSPRSLRVIRGSAETVDPDWHISVTNDSGESFSAQFPSQLEFLRNNLRHLHETSEHVVLYRFRAEQIAASAYSDHSKTFVAKDGSLTAVVLADLKLADDDRFEQIQGALTKIVPSVQRIRIGPAMLTVEDHQKRVRGNKLYFDFLGAKNVPAEHASQGTLIVLALLTVLHSPERPSVILLDDFDHSLHPRAQMELVRMLQDLLKESRGTQIITTTHSPYVLDEVSPSNVIAFALRPDGTVAAKQLSEHPDAPKVNGSLKAGELWSLDAERDWVL